MALDISTEVTAYRCPACDRWAEWTDGLQSFDGEAADEFWCQTCGKETALNTMESRTQ